MNMRARFKNMLPRLVWVIIGISSLGLLAGCCGLEESGPNISQLEFNSAGLGGSDDPTYWNGDSQPMVGQIFKRVHSGDGTVHFESYYPGVAKDLANAHAIVQTPSKDHSYNVTQGPDLDVVLAYLGAKAEGKGQYIKAVSVKATNTQYAEVQNDILFTAKLNNQSAYPTVSKIVQQDTTARTNANPPLPSTSAKLWIVTKVLYAKTFSFEVKRTRELSLAAGTANSSPAAGSGSSSTSTIPVAPNATSAEAPKTSSTTGATNVNISIDAASSSSAGAKSGVSNSQTVNGLLGIVGNSLPSGNISVALTDNDDAVISYSGSTFYPIFVRIQPLVADKWGGMITPDDTKVPPFEETAGH